MNLGTRWKVQIWAVAAVLGTAAGMAAAGPPGDWTMFGKDATNTANAPDTSITSNNVAKLSPRWVLETTGDVSARAAVVKGVVYFPDWGATSYDPSCFCLVPTSDSTLWAVSAGSGKVLWSHKLSDYGLDSGAAYYHSRTSPAVDSSGILYLGTQEGAYLLAIDASTGALRWKTRLQANDPSAIVTSSPTVYKGVVYTGVASVAEGGTFLGWGDISGVAPRGSAVAVSAANGAILWQTATVPAGYTGGGVWGSNPVVDRSRNTLYVGTGNNYTNCITYDGTAASCNSPANHEDAILALDLSTGAIRWAHKLVNWGQQTSGVADGSDSWNVDCFFFGPQCPQNAGPDYDFGSAPNLVTYQTASGPKTIIGAGQKSGIYYALDPDTGAELWHTQVGPGSSLGGMEWGSASDGKRIYVAIANFYGISYLAGFAGSWAALDPATGSILWQTSDPNGAIDIGPVSVAKDVVYVGSMAGSAGQPSMLALDSATGQVLWEFAAGSSVNAGATVVGGSVYWGSGYAHLGIPGYTGNNKFYAFSLSK
jgi:polyvinyl alcohol dehydrogenase (cytochrome)